MNPVLAPREFDEWLRDWIRVQASARSNEGAVDFDEDD